MKTRESLLLLVAATAWSFYAAAKFPKPDDRNPKSKTALQNLTMYPLADSGQKRIVIILPPRAGEENCKVEVMAGKNMLVDKCNRFFMNGSFAVRQVDGFGYDYYLVQSNGEPGATLMACPEQKMQPAFVSVVNENLLRYNSRMPVVVYVPQDFEVKYRVWSAGKTQTVTKGTKASGSKGIRDCPEEMIINKMPTIGKQNSPDRYYIYKGARREVTDFDTAWLLKNCKNIRVEAVY